MSGRCTKIASIEMSEAIGEKQVAPASATIDRLLGPEGRACIRTILVPDERRDRCRRSPDRIEHSAFPGCPSPSLCALAARSAGASRPVVSEVPRIGRHRAEALRHWRESFSCGIERVPGLGHDERFGRTRTFHLAFYEAALRTRRLRDARLTLLPSLGG